MGTTLQTNAFVTLDEMRRHLGLRLEDNSHDGRLIDIANFVAELVESIAGRKLKQQAYTNVLMSGENTDTLAVENYPLATSPAPTVKVSTTRAFSQVDALEFWNNDSGQSAGNAELIASDSEAGLLQRIDGGTFPAFPPKSILISYTGGIPSTEWAPLREASLILVGHFFHGEGRDLSIRSMALPGVSRTWSADALPERAMKIIRRYSRGGFSL